MTEDDNEYSEEEKKYFKKRGYFFLGLTCVITVLLMFAACSMGNYLIEHHKFETVVQQLNRLSTDAEKASGS